MRRFYILTISLLCIFCGLASNEFEEMPLVREGVKWVNEKVVINHGDTTCTYYTYEIKGDAPADGPNDDFITPGQYKACHYYTGFQIDEDNDSIIGQLWSENNDITYARKNWAIAKIMSEGRNMLGVTTISLDGREFLYYSFVLPGVYFGLQLEPEFLSDENFHSVDPIEIDGVICHRLAFFSEEGDTLAYLVGGIGFDSRDMGDLLTPFTRQPDPDADYQEYCGLSHVIKDGKIIYKGMRYRKSAFDAIDEVVDDKSPQEFDDNYYNLMGMTVGKEVPTNPGIYIHQGKKIIVR